MRVVVLGGMGLQGRAAVVDLAASRDVDEVICADSGPNRLGRLSGLPGMSKVRAIEADLSSKGALVSMLKQQVDAAIDLLPLPLMPAAFEAAVEAGVPLVSTNYAHTVRHIDAPAREAGVIIMPECGLDPGIDLVIIGHGARQFDRLEILESYCGGIPEPAACDNPLNYKVSWNWEMVLNSQMRPSVFIRDGRRLEIPAENQHDPHLIHNIVFPGLGELEAIPNGDAVFYTDLLELTGTIRRTGRYALRWPGWSAFWRPLKQLGFLDENPLEGLPGPVSPRRFLARLIEPRIQYQNNEKDLAVMFNLFEGLKEGRPKRMTTRLLIERDLTSGLMAMSMGVGFTAGIVAQMIVQGRINGAGLLSPVCDVPFEPFMEELAARGVHSEVQEEWLDKSID